MPLPFLCKAVYFSFLDDKSTIITSDIKIPRSLLLDMSEVNNLVINTNGVQVSLPVADYDSAYMGTQNCLLVSKVKSEEILIYHITDYKFVGKYMTINAINTPYTINKNNITTDSDYYIINTQLPDNAITTFIEWGYAHDSVCKEDGTLNITRTKDSDLYHPCYNGACEIVKYREKLVFDLCDNETDSRFLSDNISYWVYVYVEPRKYVVATTGDSGDREQTLYGSTFDRINLPYGILCFPIYKDGVVPFMFYNSNQTTQLDINPIDSRAFLLFRELNNDTSYIYSLKMSATPPTPKINYTRVGNKFYIHGGTPEEINTQYNIFIMGSPTSEVSYAFFQVEPNSQKPFETLPILNSTLQEYGYPVGTRTGQIVTNQVFKSKENPYIALYTNRLRIKNSTGDEYDYSPLDLGLFYNIGFKLYDPRTIDNTSCFLCVDTSYLTYSILNDDTITSYNGLLTTSNSDLVYNTDLLAEYLANNKNTYNSFYLRRNLGLGRKIMDGIPQIIAGAFTKDWASVSKGANDILTAGVNAFASTKQFNWSLENLQSAKDKINYTNNSMYLGADIMGLGYFVEVVSTTEYAKELLYQEFIDKGINMNKYVPNDRVSKYLSITDNAYDKANYKFVKANATLKGGNLYNTKQLLVYKNYLQNGVQMIKTDDIVVSESATNQDNVLNNISEEEIN